jgi:hypothetical protein
MSTRARKSRLRFDATLVVHRRWTHAHAKLANIIDSRTVRKKDMLPDRGKLIGWRWLLPHAGGGLLQRALDIELRLAELVGG